MEMAFPRKGVSGFAGILLFLLVLSAFFLYAFPAPNLLYLALILFHVGGGLVAALLLVPRLVSAFQNESVAARAGWTMMAVAAALGIVLIFKGTVRAEWNLLYVHIAFAALASVLLLANWLRESGRVASVAATGATMVALAVATIAL